MSLSLSAPEGGGSDGGALKSFFQDPINTVGQQILSFAVIKDQINLNKLSFKHSCRCG